MQKLDAIYSGKAKTLYRTDEPNRLIVTFRDDATAFNAQKMASLAGKGRTNNLFNTAIMKRLQAAQIPTHFVSQLSDTEAVVQTLTMIPVECVVRNRAAGSICKRLGLEKGQIFKTPIFEFFYKDDALGDPMINEEHILALGWATQAQIEEMKRLTHAVNAVLQPYFDQAGLILVDYKLEFGVNAEGQLCLGDEFSPDGCRIWDKETGYIYDKDRFRQDLGDVIESYQLVAQKLGIAL